MIQQQPEISNQVRLDLLREALPYIQRFKGKTFVVKLSGKATEDAANLASLAEELALLHQVGIRLCVVHGGGKQLTELASLMGVEQTIINGRRVTDDATLEMAKMVFAGKINTDILAALRHRGVEAVGLSGVDGNIVHAERRPPGEVLNSASTSATSATWWRSTRGSSACCWSRATCLWSPRSARTGKGPSSTSTPTRLRRR
jgi:Amino acid kinase family